MKKPQCDVMKGATEEHYGTLNRQSLEQNILQGWSNALTNQLGRGTADMYNLADMFRVFLKLEKVKPFHF